ncbi:uncharacterized protein EHS24_005420 [Apiotrichum porosum]|uniref:Uncharacterized protein n=1 Tax=Apiotrichum porosum TaxID=105984 RepID=A0A427XD36_9TREE|nr:uncharacterized protein EHS24_005420 [Apiotrichum porosum]RSH76673.1 hypothetical protein EHS24_005420 [Apiotrichum porosum]
MPWQQGGRFDLNRNVRRFPVRVCDGDADGNNYWKACVHIWVPVAFNLYEIRKHMWKRTFGDCTGNRMGFNRGKWCTGEWLNLTSYQLVFRCKFCKREMDTNPWDGK